MILVTDFHMVSKAKINKGHPVHLLLPVWFPALTILVCACDGCEFCQADLERYRAFLPAINIRLGI